MQQEASQRATDGLQPERSDTEEFQAEGRQQGKVPGGRERGEEGENEEGGARLWFVVKEDEKTEEYGLRDHSPGVVRSNVSFSEEHSAYLCYVGTFRWHIFILRLFT